MIESKGNLKNKTTEKASEFIPKDMIKIKEK